jgi:pimeloyl-ACP methyl ester carboxylesterase
MDSSQSLYYLTAGSKENPAILFLHGSPLTGKMWQPQMERLVDFYCIVPDLPGHGRSEAVPFVMADTVERLAQIIRSEALGGKAHVVGFSFGGVVALAMMAAHPELVDKVILSGTSARLSKFLVCLQSLNEPIMRMMKPAQLANMVTKQFGIPDQYLASISADFDTFSIDAFSAVMKSYGDIALPEQTQSPTLVCVGSKETPVARSMARKIAHTLPGAKGITVPGGTHVWSMQMPDLFCEVVRAWFKTQPLPGGLIGF